MKSSIGTRGQTVIPKRIREQLHLEEGDQLDWSLEPNGVMVVRPRQAAPDPFTLALGTFSLPAGQSTEELLLEVRGERDPTRAQAPGARIVSVAELLGQPT